MASSAGHPTHLDASELGTKEYWDNYYQNDLEQDEGEDEPGDPSELESWFDDVDAPAKVLEYLTSDEFPLAPNAHSDDHEVSVLDLGTGNGSMLFSLRLEGRFQGRMVGVDYSKQSIDLAKRLWQQYSQHDSSLESIEFTRTDLIQDEPQSQSWWHRDGFNLVLDKGTFDAISLSSETVNDGNGHTVRICELYPRKCVDLVRPGGYLLVTSCNWTEEELTSWFLRGEGVDGRFKVFGTINYPVYEFGGQKGQGVASVCFQRVPRV